MLCAALYQVEITDDTLLSCTEMSDNHTDTIRFGKFSEVLQTYLTGDLREPFTYLLHINLSFLVCQSPGLQAKNSIHKGTFSCKRIDVFCIVNAVLSYTVVRVWRASWRPPGGPALLAAHSRGRNQVANDTRHACARGPQKTP